MATTNSNFVALSASALAGASAVNVAIVAPPAVASRYLSTGQGVILDQSSTDLSKAAFAKNGCVILALVVSTPQTIDFTALSGAATAGDTSFATVNTVVFWNQGAHDIVVSPGSSNPFPGPLGGTAPTFTVPAGAQLPWQCPAGWTISGSVKNLKCDPGGNAGLLSLCIGGA